MLCMSPAHRIASVEIHDDGFALVLASGQRLRDGWAPRLAKATRAEREAFVILDEGTSLHWPALFPEGARPHVSVHTLLWEERMNDALARLAAAGHDLSKLDDDDHDVVVLFRLEADVNNGGFMQFLCNWGDDTVQRSLRVLEALGASRMHAIVREMRGILDRLEDDPRITQLWDLYGAMTAEEHARMGELDRAFWAYPDDLPRLAAERYAV